MKNLSQFTLVNIPMVLLRAALFGSSTHSFN